MYPVIFILSLLAATVFIVALTHISMLTLVLPQRDVSDGNRQPDRQNAIQNKAKSVSADFAALIDAIANEGRASRAEEQREDDNKKLREWITIALIALTLGAVGWQVSEMMKVYDPIRDQADASKQFAAATAATQRAWVGQADGKIDGSLQPDGTYAKLTAGTSFIVTASYRNSGHEPATNVINFPVVPRIYTLTEWTSGPSTTDIEGIQKRCVDPTNTVRGSVMFPSDAPTTQLLTDFSNPDGPFGVVLMTNDILQGTSVIAFLYCVQYTAG